MPLVNFSFLYQLFLCILFCYIGASSVITEGSMHGMMHSTILENQSGANKENLDPDNTDDWLHRNDSYRPRFSARKTSSLQQGGESSVLSETIHIILCIALYFDFNRKNTHFNKLFPSNQMELLNIKVYKNLLFVRSFQILTTLNLIAHYSSLQMKI